jgi:hypothetical protein
MKKYIRRVAVVAIGVGLTLASAAVAYPSGILFSHPGGGHGAGHEQGGTGGGGGPGK